MFLALNHQKLEVYIISRQLTIECYRFVKQLPPEEKFGIISQIRRAALSIILNIAEGVSRRSQAERKRFYEIARGSLIEIDAAFDIAEDLGYFRNYAKDELSKLVLSCFKLLSNLIASQIK